MQSESELTHLRIYDDPLYQIETKFRFFLDACFSKKPKNTLAEFASNLNLDVETFNLKKEDELSQKFFYNLVTNNIGKTSYLQVTFNNFYCLYMNE